MDTKKLLKFEEEVKVGDSTNREGHAAKVYFNLLYGIDFNRSTEDNTNKALDYGYSILLSIFNREIVKKDILLHWELITGMNLINLIFLVI